MLVKIINLDWSEQVFQFSSESYGKAVAFYSKLVQEGQLITYSITL